MVEKYYFLIIPCANSYLEDYLGITQLPSKPKLISKIVSERDFLKPCHGEKLFMYLKTDYLVFEFNDNVFSIS